MMDTDGNGGMQAGIREGMQTVRCLYEGDE
jgi:hypothetical protein